MEYEALIFVSEKQLAAIDINSSGTQDTISLNGNMIMQYSGSEDIDTFCSCLTDYYNIDSFSEIEIAIKIIVFGPCKNTSLHLLEKMKHAASVNIMDAKMLLSILLMGETKVQKGKTYYMEAFSVLYRLDVHDNLHVNCSEAKKKVSGQNVYRCDMESFSFLSEFDYSRWNHDDEEKYKKIVEQNTIEKKKLTEDYQKLLEKYNSECEKLKKEKKKGAELKAELAEIEKRKNRVICKINLDEMFPSTSKNSIAGAPFNAINKGIMAVYKTVGIITSFEVIPCCQDGILVKKQKVIAKVNQINQLNEAESKTEVGKIKTTCDGRIFYLDIAGKQVKDQDAIAYWRAFRHKRRGTEVVQRN